MASMPWKEAVLETDPYICEEGEQRGMGEWLTKKSDSYSYNGGILKKIP